MPIFGRQKKEKEDYLAEGARILEEEIANSVDYSVSLQNESALRNIEILSDELIANKHLHKNVKKKIKEYQKNFSKILAATAKFIEEEKFSSVDQALDYIDLGRFDRKRISDLFLIQKRISFSFQTLNVAIEFFAKINESLLEKIEQSDPSTQRFEHTKLLLKNAILVYELTSFIAKYIEKYGLVGIEELDTIRQDVYKDLHQQQKEEENLQAKLKSAHLDETRKMILRDIQNRKKVIDLVKRKWNEFDNRIKRLQEGVDSSKKIIADLELIRMNARNQINLLQVMVSVQIVQDNLDIIKNLSHIKNFALAPLTPEDAMALLGIPSDALSEPSE